MKKKGFLATIAAPSGGGKTTICNGILKMNKTVSYSISWTTRPPRGTEKHGVDYFFTDLHTFQTKVNEKFFLEFADVHGHFYGTPKETIDDFLADERIVLLDIDVQGVDLLRLQGYDLITIFILPKNESILKHRLVHRGTDTPESIYKRLENAKKEIKYLYNYDYLVINDDIKEAISIVNSILVAEKSKLKRYINPINDFYGVIRDTNEIGDPNENKK